MCGVCVCVCVCVWLSDPAVTAAGDKVLDDHVRAAVACYFTHIPGTDYFYFSADADGRHDPEDFNDEVAEMARDIVDGESSDSDSGLSDYDFADEDERRQVKHDRYVVCGHVWCWCAGRHPTTAAAVSSSDSESDGGGSHTRTGRRKSKSEADGEHKGRHGTHGHHDDDDGVDDGGDEDKAHGLGVMEGASDEPEFSQPFFLRLEVCYPRPTHTRSYGGTWLATHASLGATDSVCAPLREANRRWERFDRGGSLMSPPLRPIDDVSVGASDDGSDSARAYNGGGGGQNAVGFGFGGAGTSVVGTQAPTQSVAPDVPSFTLDGAAVGLPPPPSPHLGPGFGGPMPTASVGVSASYSTGVSVTATSATPAVSAPPSSRAATIARASVAARGRTDSAASAASTVSDPGQSVAAAIAQMLSWGTTGSRGEARTVCRIVGMSLPSHVRHPGGVVGAAKRAKAMSELPRHHAKALRRLRLALRSLFVSSVLRLMLRSQPVEPSGVELAQDLMAILPDAMISRFFVPLRFVHETMGMRLFAVEIERPAAGRHLVLRRVGNLYLVVSETGVPEHLLPTSDAAQHSRAHTSAATKSWGKAGTHGGKNSRRRSSAGGGTPATTGFMPASSGSYGVGGGDGDAPTQGYNVPQRVLSKLPLMP